MDRPSRPARVPETAIFQPEAGLWQQGARDASGSQHGPFETWRADGTPYERGQYQGGVRVGPFTVFHPDGAVARQGTYAGGEIDGPMAAWASDAPDAEPLRTCCVPPGAARMRAEYREGRLLAEVFTDRDGRTLLADGSVRPERPAAVPDSARFEDSTRRWVVGAAGTETGSPDGRWRWWTENGRLDEEADFQGGHRRRAARWDAHGLVEETHFDDDERRSGPSLRRWTGGPTPYADPRVVEERGQWASGQSVDAWSLRDADGVEVGHAQRGIAWPDADLSSPALAEDRRDARGWRALAEDLRAEGRVREAALAAARALARDGDATALVSLLSTTSPRLGAEARAHCESELQAASDDTPRAGLEALLAGAGPAHALRVVASRLMHAPRAACDLASAAVALDPDDPAARLTRALARLELGDTDGAREDAGRMASRDAAGADFLRDYVRVMFPAFDFWPARETPAAAPPDLPAAPAQPLAAVQRAVQVYATRLDRLRAAAAAGAQAEKAPSIPDVRALLPDGLIELRCFDAEILDQTDDGTGTEATPVRIDETLDVAHWPLSGLMRLARVEWTGLTWLCWSTGLGEVTWPATLAPPEAFADATAMVIARAARAQDVLVTGGLRSLTAGVPSFLWEGLDVDRVPRILAEMAAHEYREARAVFLWLMFSENVSPFQSDLRDL